MRAPPFVQSFSSLSLPLTLPAYNVLQPKIFSSRKELLGNGAPASFLVGPGLLKAIIKHRGEDARRGGPRLAVRKKAHLAFFAPNYDLVHRNSAHTHIFPLVRQGLEETFII